MKTNFHLMAVTIILLSASLAGCFGDDDSGSDEYDGPIDLVIFYDATSGMIEATVNNGQNGPATGVELSFDFADTTSEDGDIVKIMIDPDDGSDPIEADPSENAVLTYTWLTHGVFDVKLSVEDEEGNEHWKNIDVKIDMRVVWEETNTASASQEFDATPDCEDGDPLPDRITITSTVTNPGGPPWAPGGNSDVSWYLNNPGGETIGESEGTLSPDTPETWEYTTRDTAEGIWTLLVEVDQDGANTDNVNVNNEVIIVYAEGAEDSPNPREE